MIWSPCLPKKKHRKAGESTEKSTKFILKTEDSYDTLLKELNLISLENGRLVADVTFLRKALNGITDIDVRSYVDFYDSFMRKLTAIPLHIMIIYF